jgi:hypothetical protein
MTMTDIEDSALVARVVCHPKGWKSHQTRWSAVGCVFSVGSTTAARLCREHGENPNETRREHEERGFDD